MKRLHQLGLKTFKSSVMQLQFHVTNPSLHATNKVWCKQNQERRRYMLSMSNPFCTYKYIHTDAAWPELCTTE